MFYNKIIPMLFSLTLLSCTNENDNSSQRDQTGGFNTQASNSTKNSKLLAYISEENRCELIIPKQQLKELFNIITPINVDGSEYNGDAYCDINWQRADKVKRQEKYGSYLVNSVSGTLKQKVPMRLRTLTSSFRIVLSKTNTAITDFVPQPKSEEAIQFLINQATKATNDALTKEQKSFAGGEANNMIASMIRKNNQTSAVADLGDAAYWSNFMDGSLNVLDGDANIEITIIKIGNSIEEDKNNAIKIAKAIISRIPS